MKAKECYIRIKNIFPEVSVKRVNLKSMKIDLKKAMELFLSLFHSMVSFFCQTSFTSKEEISNIFTLKMNRNENSNYIWLMKSWKNPFNLKGGALKAVSEKWKGKKLIDSFGFKVVIMEAMESFQRFFFIFERRCLIYRLHWALLCYCLICSWLLV